MKYKITLSLITAVCLSNNIYAKDVQKLDIVTVTAQKVEENAQRVPISLTVFDEFAIEDKKIETIEDIAQYTPNLMMFSYGRSDAISPSLRGVSSNIVNQDVTVGVYIDGVPMFDGWSLNETLNDIQRIEVLKGPQGTLYGKNTETGVINIITKQPNNETILKSTLELGNDNKRQIKLNASGAIIKDKLYGGVSVNHYEKDGFLKDKVTGKILDDRQRDSGKINLRYTPTDKLDISFINSIMKLNDGGARWGMANQTRNDISSDVESYNKSKIINSSLKIKYDISNYSFLESVTTRRFFHNASLGDWDFTNDPNKKYHLTLDSETTSYSQELRYNHNLINDRLNLLLGVYTDTVDEDKSLLFETIPAYGGTLLSLSTFNNRSLGIFAHAKYALTNKLKVLGGIRFDKDTKKYKDSSISIDESKDYTATSPKLGLEYQIDKDIMTFLTISKGYRAGGFNEALNTSKDDIFYDKESLTSYEIGIKSLLFNNRLLFNANIYYMDIKDMQVTEVISPRLEIVTNAGEAHSQGFEIETQYQINDSLEIFANIGYNITIFDKYTDNTFDMMGNPMGTVDYKGKINPFAPKYNYSIGAQYRDASGYYARVDINGYGKMYFDKANEYERKAYTLVNTKIGYEHNNFDIYFYAKNLFDKKYDSKGFNKFYTIYSDPREIGVQLVYRF
ncbi:TonB-dependent receptor [Sulfurimonas sp.]|uniref:TonB-dependent receptor n=1 Tax=Sulfurimonas sp. TaxID=2022749 RepID=UPI002B47F25D|nr:TonB-dependent receptor [Sulfurimonas sp.]